VTLLVHPVSSLLAAEGRVIDPWKGQPVHRRVIRGGATDPSNGAAKADVVE
jgi:hypothetical protein